MPKKEKKNIQDILIELYSEMDVLADQLFAKEVALAKVKDKYYVLKSYHTMGDQISNLRSADLRSAELTLIMANEDITKERQQLEYEVMELNRQYELMGLKINILRDLVRVGRIDL